MSRGRSFGALRLAAIACSGWLAASWLAACSLAPDYARPATPDPPAYKEASAVETDGWKAAEPSDGKSRPPWWRIFNDGRLDALEDQVTEANQDIKAALARFQQARAAARVARADFYPTVTATGSVKRDRTSATVANPITKRDYTDWLLEADLSYEIDVWGRIRNAAAAAESTAQASAGDLGAMSLSLHAELATDYYMLRGYDSQQAILDQTVKDYEKALQLTLDRYHGGIAAEVDVDQARTQLESAKTQAAENALRRQQLEHAIAVLTGQAASSFGEPPSPLVVNPPAIDPGLPSELLERRPDVAAAERRAAAANAQIGVARAAFYPRFNIDTLAGFESAIPGRWFTAPSRVWSLGPSALLVLFDAGRREGLTDEARAAYDETVANYRSTVLGAFRDVEDNLVALRKLEQEGVTEEAAVAAAGRTLTQARYRYTGGIATYLEVVAAENAALSTRLSAVDVLTRRMTAVVLLVKALGGGWEADTGLVVSKDKDPGAAQLPDAAPSATPVAATPVAATPPADQTPADQTPAAALPPTPAEMPPPVADMPPADQAPPAPQMPVAETPPAPQMPAADTPPVADTPPASEPLPGN